MPDCRIESTDRRQLWLRVPRETKLIMSVRYLTLGKVSGLVHFPQCSIAVMPTVALTTAEIQDK